MSNLDKYLKKQQTLMSLALVALLLVIPITIYAQTTNSTTDPDVDETDAFQAGWLTLDSIVTLATTVVAIVLVIARKFDLGKIADVALAAQTGLNGYQSVRSDLKDVAEATWNQAIPEQAKNIANKQAVKISALNDKVVHANEVVTNVGGKLEKLLSRFTPEQLEVLLQASKQPV